MAADCAAPEMFGDMRNRNGPLPGTSRTKASKLCGPAGRAGRADGRTGRAVGLFNGRTGTGPGGLGGLVGGRDVGAVGRPGAGLTGAGEGVATPPCCWAATAAWAACWSCARASAPLQRHHLHCSGKPCELCYRV